MPQYLKAVGDAARALKAGPVEHAFVTLPEIEVAGKRVLISAPATGVGKTIVFGRHDDVRKQNVYATVSGSPSIAKVAANRRVIFRSARA